MDYSKLFSPGAAISPGLASSQLSSAFDDLRKANAQLQSQLAGGGSASPGHVSTNQILTPASVTRMSQHFASPRGRPSRSAANSVTAALQARPPLGPTRHWAEESTKELKEKFDSFHSVSTTLAASSTAVSATVDRPPLPSLPAAVPPHSDTPLAPTAPASSLYQAAQAWRAAAAYSEAKAAAAAVGAAEQAARASQAQTEAEHLHTALRAAEDQQADTSRQCENCEAEVRVLRMHLQALQAPSGSEGGGLEAPAGTGTGTTHPRRQP